MTRHILKMVWNRKRSNALMVLEIFLSFLVLFIVLTLASALIGSVRKPLGFEWRDVWNISVAGTGQHGPRSSEQKAETISLIMRELRSMPEVVAVATSDMPAYSMGSREGRWTIDGKRVFVTRDLVSDDFAEVMQLQLLRGRWFGPQDDAANYAPIVIDADLAGTLYGTDDPIGRKFDNGSAADGEMRVVGVVAPYRKSGEFANFGKPVNMMFSRVRVETAERTPDSLVIRLRPGTPAAFEQRLSERLHQVAPQMNFRIRQMSRMRHFAHRTAMFPLIALGMVATFLIAMVVLGLSGVLWQNVTRRTREIGLRRAIGATAPAVQRQIVGEVAILTTLAVILGLAVVTQLPLLGLFTIITPGAFVGGLVGSLAAVYALTALCGLYPGWLASRVQPAQALHYE